VNLTVHTPSQEPKKRRRSREDRKRSSQSQKQGGNSTHESIFADVTNLRSIERSSKPFIDESMSDCEDKESRKQGSSMFQQPTNSFEIKKE
jgi:hypothetical protein